MRVLIVEDEQHLSIGLRFNFEAEGYEVAVAPDGHDALKQFEADPDSFSVVILDLMLPGMSGYETCQMIRGIRKNIPILALSARTLSEDKTRAFDVGVDQYMTKPFDLGELLSRVRNLLQRHPTTHAGATVSEEPKGEKGEKLQCVDFGNAHVDFRRLTVTVGGEPKKLSTLNFKLLQYFIAHEGFVLDRSEILREVWGFGHSPETRTVDMSVLQLRKIFEVDPTNPKHFLSIRGAGYRFVKDPSSASDVQ